MKKPRDREGASEKLCAWSPQVWDEVGGYYHESASISFRSDPDLLSVQFKPFFTPACHAGLRRPRYSSNLVPILYLLYVPHADRVQFRFLSLHHPRVLLDYREGACYVTAQVPQTISCCHLHLALLMNIVFRSDPVSTTCVYQGNAFSISLPFHRSTSSLIFRLSARVLRNRWPPVLPTSHLSDPAGILDREVP